MRRRDLRRSNQQFLFGIAGMALAVLVLSVNGAVVRMSRSLEYVRRIGVERDTAERVLALMRAAGAKPWFYSGDVCYAEELTEPLQAMQLYALSAGSV